jgi:hypothetical protein
VTVKRAGIFQDFHIVQCAFSPLPNLGDAEFSHFIGELRKLRSLHQISADFTGDRDCTIEQIGAAMPNCKILQRAR